MKLLYLCVVLIILGGTTAAQSLLHGAVSGDKKATIPFATVALFRAADSTLIKAAVADSAGRYELSRADTGAAYLLASATGYETLLLPLPDAATGLINITLRNGSATALTGTTVTARKPLIEHRADRTIFNVESSITSTGGDALDALKRAPGVLVSNSNIAIAGKSSVMVMINDRLQQLSGDELAAVLRSIPAADLARIEVISTPPARYDAAGNSGIINIITKKNTRNGLNGAISAGFEHRTKNGGNARGNVNLRYGALNVYANSNYFTSRHISDPVVATNFPTQQYRQENHEVTRQVFQRSQLGVDYNLTPDAVLGVLYTYGRGGWAYDGTDDIRTRITNLATGLTDSLLHTAATGTDHGHRNVGNLNFDWKIDTAGKRLTMDAEYFRRSGDKARNFSTRNYFADGGPTGYATDNTTTGYQLIEIKTIKADVEWPVAAAKLGYGAKASFVHDVSDNNFSFLQNGALKTDTGKTNQFSYTENTQALYLNASKDFGKKWSAQAGLRGEYTQTLGQSVTAQQSNRNRYFNLFPTAFVQYTPTEEHSFNINLSRRIERPSFWLLNPFRSYTTGTAYESGNPFLQPSYSTNAELSYVWKQKYTATLFTQQVRHYFSRVSLVDTAGSAVNFTQANTGSFSNYGVTLSASYTPFPWWEGSATVNVFYSRFSSGFYGEAFSYARPAVVAEGSNSFVLNKHRTLLLGIDFDYEASHQDDFDYRYASGSISLGVKALLLKKALTLAFSVEDPFRTDVFHVTNQFNGTDQFQYNDERSFQLSASLKFGNNRIKPKRERSVDTDARRAQ